MSRAHVRLEHNDALLLVDIQNDFCPGGALAVPRGDDVVPMANALAHHFKHVVLTQDWHPAGHLSFASSHRERRPYDVITVAYGEQVLWPDHCVQDSYGAAFHKDFHVPHAEVIIRKGFHANIDSYSTFFENDRHTPTGLGGYLRERGLNRVFIAGLAFDFCVRYSAEDAYQHGFSVFVIEDACRGIGVENSIEDTRRSFAATGIQCLISEDILGN